MAENIFVHAVVAIAAVSRTAITPLLQPLLPLLIAMLLLSSYVCTWRGFATRVLCLASQPAPDWPLKLHGSCKLCGRAHLLLLCARVSAWAAWVQSSARALQVLCALCQLPAFGQS